jgi:hypothetical protein
MSYEPPSMLAGTFAVIKGWKYHCFVAGLENWHVSASGMLQPVLGKQALQDNAALHSSAV